MKTYLSRKHSSMRSVTSPTTTRHTLSSISPTKGEKKPKVGSDAYMLERGFRPATKAESAKFAKFRR